MENKIKIALIDSGSTGLFVTEVFEKNIQNEEGDYCDTLIVEHFSNHFNHCFSESEIVWGVVETINIF